MIVFLNAYIKKNLGDDIFIKIISERYKNHKFLISNKARYLKQDNHIFYSEFHMINNIMRILSLGKISTQYFDKKKTDFSVLIGGSLYIEKNRKGLRNILYNIIDIDKYDYIIGANFGPYKSDSFYKKYYSYFAKTKDICFRDMYSYNLFKNISQCRYAPDIIFSMDTSKYINHNKKRIIISVIECNKRFSDELANNYYNKIIEIINYYRNLNYKICLMSFCKEEGDQEAIEIILNMIDNKSNIEAYFYDGDIDEALNNIGNSSIIVGTRFHANVIGMAFGKTIIPILYSDKTKNMLEDIGFNGASFDIRCKESFDISKLDNIANNHMDISKVKKKALSHFKELDKVLK